MIVTDLATHTLAPNTTKLIINAVILVALHLATYATHLLLAERADLSEFNYLVVKYGLGQSFIIFVPFTVIACKPDLREGMITTFSSAVLCPVQKRR